MQELDASTVTLEDITVPRTRLPEDICLGRSIGKGTNNRVIECTWKGVRCVLRAPRRRSDTQQRGSAVWELRHTLRASELEVGPTVMATWFARHATREWPSGLYMVMERFDEDLETVLCEDSEWMETVLERRDQIEASICRCLEVLSREHLFVFDLKPSNLVLRLRDDSVEVRVIDFGRDFCEWSGEHKDPTRCSPNIDMLSRVFDGWSDSNERITHLVFACMMVILGSTTTRTIYETRERHRMDAARRQRINPISTSVSTLLDSMEGRHVEVLRSLLRMDDVRGVLRHYHGRRNAGTHRTLCLAKGKES